MSLESQLFERTKQYLSRQVAFNDLAGWVETHEEDWAVDLQNRASQLAGMIMLMAYEVWEGKRPEDDAREPIREVATAAAGVS